MKYRPIYTLVVALLLWASLFIMIKASLRLPR